MSAVVSSTDLRAADSRATVYAAPRFNDPNRRQKIAAIAPEIDREFQQQAAAQRFPGLVWGIVLDGELIHSGTHGFANLEQKIAPAGDTRFRIASMSKSFTAMAIMRLRDARKLALDDRVEKYVPSLRSSRAITTDAPPVSIRHLLSMSPGFPEDNPWGDRQLADTSKEFDEFLREGVSFSNPPGVAFEYSNLAYALLGQIVSRVSGMPYQRYITRNILHPLGMTNTIWEYAEVPASKLALGYRAIPGGWELEPLLHDGIYGAMGGLITTLEDFARYAAFHLAAWPPRNEPENPIIRRATLREMHQPGIVSGLAPDGKTLSGAPLPAFTTYFCGLGRSINSRNEVSIAHSGGLPGFGSNYRFFPEHGFAVISFANRTYAGAGSINGKVARLILEKTGLQSRVLPVSPMLAQRQSEVANLIQSWDPELADSIAAENLFLDRSVADWKTHARTNLARIGKVSGIGELKPENQLRGTFPIIGETGRLQVFFTLTPERHPKLQELRLTIEP